MGLPKQKREELQVQFRALFEQLLSWEAMSESLHISRRTLIDWGKELGLKRKRFKRNANRDTLGNLLKCAWPDCAKDAHSRGYCASHYNKARAEGMPEASASRYFGSGSMSSAATAYADPRCDHRSSRCQCINPGRNYHTLAHKGKEQI